MTNADCTDPEVAERLMIKYGDGLFRLCFLYLSDRALAEDAAQETIVRAWQRYSQFQGTSSEKTWLNTIAINVCRGYLRSPWHRRRTPLDSLDTLPGAEAPPPDDTVLQAVLALPRKYREVVTLYYYEEHPTPEISAVLGIPRGTVSIRLKRARERLKSMLEEWYDG